MKLYKRAFTLAEVLTTLMVIGIVAALTIPNLMNSYKKHATTVSVKKMYSQLSQAVKMVPLEFGCEVGNYACANIFHDISADRINEDFVIAMHKQLKGSILKIEGGCGNVYSQPCIILPDNSSIRFNFTTNTIPGSPATYKNIRTILYFNTNEKIKNTKAGVNLFMYSIATETKNGIEAGTVMPWGSRQSAIYEGNDSLYWKNHSNGCKDGDPSTFCTGRLIEEGKITYY